MEQSNEMLDRFRQMLGAVDEGLSDARSRRLGARQPAPVPPAPSADTVIQTTGRPRFKAVRIVTPGEEHDA